MIKNSAYTKKDFEAKLNSEPTDFSNLKLPYAGDGMFQWLKDGEVLAADDSLIRLMYIISQSGYIKPNFDKMLSEIQTKLRFVYALGIFEVRFKRRYA